MLRGGFLGDPMISLTNGVLSWSFDRAVAFVVRIDGAAVGGDGLYRETTLFVDAPELIGKPLDVEIEPITGGVSSGAFRVRVDAEHKRLALLPVGVTVEDGALLWRPVLGAAGYRVVDIERNATVVADTYYEMHAGKPIYGVFPVSAIDGVADAAIARTDIKYLEGEGTEASPYLIRTPFDLGAVDYYEALYAEDGGRAPRNRYLIVNDIDYGAVAELEENSNVKQLSQPFFGVLDGGGNRLSGLRVEYDGGHWALFEFIAEGGEVRNIVFDEPSIKNVLRLKYYPIDASVATVAHINRGTITKASVVGATYSAAGGTVAGICTHNFGTVSRCSVSGELVQGNTGLDGQACCEMAGIVTENCRGGIVERNAAELSVRGMRLSGYVNVGTVGGIVAVNRRGARVRGNAVTSLSVVGEYELGGIVGYNAGDARECGVTEKFICNGLEMTCDVGTAENGRCGRLIGKDDGENDG